MIALHAYRNVYLRVLVIFFSTSFTYPIGLTITDSYCILACNSQIWVYDDEWISSKIIEFNQTFDTSSSSIKENYIERWHVFNYFSLLSLSLFPVMIWHWNSYACAINFVCKRITNRQNKIQFHNKSIPDLWPFEWKINRKVHRPMKQRPLYV